MPYKFEEGENDLGELMKQLNLQAVENLKGGPMFKESLISLELSDSDIETAVQTWGTVEDNLLVHNSVV